MKKNILFALITVMFFCACSEKTVPGSSETSITTESEKISTTDQREKSPSSSSEEKDSQNRPEKKEQEIYRLVASFYSIGEGTDSKAIKSFENFIYDYQTQNKKPINFERAAWGREGEVDFCVNLDNYDKSQQANFVTLTREILFQCKLVHIVENTICRHKRQ